MEIDGNRCDEKKKDVYSSLVHFVLTSVLSFSNSSLDNLTRIDNLTILNRIL